MDARDIQSSAPEVKGTEADTFTNHHGKHNVIQRHLIVLLLHLVKGFCSNVQLQTTAETEGRGKTSCSLVQMRREGGRTSPSEHKRMLHNWWKVDH